MLLDSDLDDIREYHAHVESSLRKRLDEFAGAAEKWPAERQEEYFNERYDELALTRDTLPQVLRATLVSALCAMMEERLARICGIVQRRKGLKLSSSELKGSSIEQVQKYIKIVANCAFPDESKSWQNAQHVQHVRNALVHTGGRVPRGDKGARLRKAVESLPGIEIRSGDQLHIEPQFIDSLICNVRSVCCEIAESSLS